MKKQKLGFNYLWKWEWEKISTKIRFSSSNFHDKN